VRNLSLSRSLGGRFARQLVCDASLQYVADMLSSMSDGIRMVHIAKLANACFAAATVCCRSCSVWAAPRNAASNCDGGR